MSNLETLLTVFIMVTAVAVVIQMGVLLALYTRVKKTSARMDALLNEVNARVAPTLEIAQKIVQEGRPKVEMILNNLAAASALLKQELERIDETVTDTVDRARLQVIRMDELVSRAVDQVESTAELLHHTVISPVRLASSVLRGVITGLATFFDRGPYAGASRRPGTPKEDMFI